MSGGCTKPDCSAAPAKCPPCGGATKGEEEKPKCTLDLGVLDCGTQGRPYYSCPTECTYKDKYDLDADPIELTSSNETWCDYGLRILFTNPKTPVEVKPEAGCPLPMTVCVQFRNEACISPECVTSICHSNLKTNENPEGEKADFCMLHNPCLSEYECFTQTHMYQVCLLPIADDNKDIKFKITYMNLTIWAADEKDEKKEGELDEQEKPTE